MAKNRLAGEVSRREWIGLASFGVAGLARGGSGFGGTPELTPLNRFPRMLQEYYVARVREIERVGLARKQALRTRADALAYQRDIRQRVRDCFGPLPEKTPLRAQITGTVERESYRIEKILFESRPGLLVTGNLYLPRRPKGASGRLPGVIATCGHSNNGKAIETYQSFTQGLAKLDYVVFIIDPLGQGERLQYPDGKGGSRIGVGVDEHLHLGNQQLLTGENFPFWRAWDAIRALDYLETRPEVDPRRIGVTGNSGGGTVATWLCGLDDRWAMAAPGCFITTLRRNIENELPQDSEQYPPRALAKGLDLDDFIAAMAPKPVIILAKEKDYFDVRGAEEAYRRLKRLYTLLGAPEKIALHIGPTPHGYSKENREAMYRWFHRHTGRTAQITAEPEIVLEKDETLQVTPAGQVAALGSRSVFSFTAEAARRLARERRPVTAAALPTAIKTVLRLPASPPRPDARILREISPRGYPRPKFTTYAVETEPGIQALVYRLSGTSHFSRPAKGAGATILYVSHLSSDAELRTEPLVRELLANSPEAAVYACDVRGIGESIPNTAGEDRFDLPYGSEYLYAGFSLMLDEPLIGRRTYDLLRVISWLEGYGQRPIHLVARGRGTLPATFAAVLSESVTQVTLKHPLTSYTDVATTEEYQCPLSCIIPGILKSFDLPDCYQALEKKGLRMIEPLRSVGELQRS
ncbi:MAG: alpha/beta hydrolase family protein [Acidobacteriota bacterium]